MSATHLVNVDDAALCADEILPRLEIQLVKDRFDVIADVSRLREARRVRDHVEASEGLHDVHLELGGDERPSLEILGVDPFPL